MGTSTGCLWSVTAFSEVKTSKRVGPNLPQLPQLSYTVPGVLVTSNHGITFLLLQNWNFATVVNPNINVWYAGYLI